MAADSTFSRHDRLWRFINIILLFLTIGSCVFIISVINSSDIYIKILEKSQKIGSEHYLLVAKIILNTPVLFLMILLSIFSLLKEFYVDSLSTKLKINFISVIVLFSLCLVVIKVISSPAIS